MVDGYYCTSCNCGIKDLDKRRGHQHARSCPYGVFIYYADELKDRKVEDVQSTNSKAVRQILAKEQKKLADSGEVMKEQELRSDIRTRAQLGLSTNTVGPSADDKAKRGRLRQ